jgi:hypothetical protein
MMPPDGYSVRCLDEPEKVYRWTDNELRYYPSGQIASSWNTAWREDLVQIDCTSIPMGSPMSMNFGSLTMSRAADGFSEAEVYSVRCLEEPDKVYRWHESELHHYPSSIIASSWDKDWREALVEMDCANIPKGAPMSVKNLRVSYSWRYFFTKEPIDITTAAPTISPVDNDVLVDLIVEEPIDTTISAPTISPIDGDVLVDLVAEESCELQKVEAGRILTWFEARDYDIERYYLPTKKDLMSHNVRPDRGISVDEWQPVRRLDGVEVDYVQIGTLHSGYRGYRSHYFRGVVPSWGYNNKFYPWRSTYFYACLL